MASFSGVQRKELRRGWVRPIEKAEEVLSFQIGHNLCFPKKLIITGEFNGDKMMYGGKIVG